MKATLWRMLIFTLRTSPRLGLAGEQNQHNEERPERKYQLRLSRVE